MQEETIGSRICAARQAAGLSQRELAERIARADRVDGLSPSALSRIESSRRRVASHELAELADVLGVSVDDLLGTRQRSAALVLAARVTRAAPADYRMVAGRARQILEADDLLSRIVPAGAPLSMPSIPNEDVPVTKTAGESWRSGHERHWGSAMGRSVISRRSSRSTSARTSSSNRFPKGCTGSAHCARRRERCPRQR